MRRFLILLLPLVVSKAMINITNNEISTKALEDVTNELFVKHKIDFDYVTLGKASNLINDTIREMLTSKPMENALEVKQVNRLSQWVGKAALVFVNSWKTLIHFFAVTRKPQKHSKILFFLAKAQGNILDEMYLDLGLSRREMLLWDNQISQFYFLIETDTKYELKILSSCSEEKCDQLQFVNINEFDKKTGKWRDTQGILKAEKYPNFNGRTFKMFTQFFILPTFDLLNDAGYASLHASIQPTLDKRNQKELEIVRIYEEKLNFKAEVIQSRFDPNAEIHIVQLWDGACSYAWTQYTIKTMFTPPEPYSNYEKMLLPFDFQTWLYLGIVFGLCFFGIFIVNQLPQIVRNLVYGQGINMPSFNVGAIIFGIGQTKLPENNFGRIILMTFILFCLIMRTAYQGVFFEMFTNDMRRPPPETFADLKERNYTIFNVETQHWNWNLDFVPENDRPRMTYVGFSRIHDIFQSMSDWKLKASILTSEVDMKVYKATFNNVPKMIKEEIVYAPPRSCVDYESFFASAHVKLSNALVSAGIIQYWFSYFLDFELQALEEPPQEPQVFSIDDLKFGFNVWLIACAITIGVFVVELSYFYGKKLMRWITRKVINCIVMLLIVKFVSMKNFM